MPANMTGREWLTELTHAIVEKLAKKRGYAKWPSKAEVDLTLEAYGYLKEAINKEEGE